GRDGFLFLLVKIREIRKLFAPLLGLGKEIILFFEASGFFLELLGFGLDLLVGFSFRLRGFFLGLGFRFGGLFGRRRADLLAPLGRLATQARSGQKFFS